MASLIIFRTLCHTSIYDYSRYFSVVPFLTVPALSLIPEMKIQQVWTHSSEVLGAF